MLNRIAAFLIGMTVVLWVVAPSASADEPCAEDICPIDAGDHITAIPAPPPAPPRPTVESRFHHHSDSCVSPREYRAARLGVTKAELERQWGVVGAGRLRDVVVIGLAWIYPRCGRDFSKVFYAALLEDGRLYGKAAVE